MYFGMLLSKANQNRIFMNTSLLNLFIVIGLLNLNSNLYSNYCSFILGVYKLNLGSRCFN
jgi:hypothetical protein